MESPPSLQEQIHDKTVVDNSSPDSTKLASQVEIRPEKEKPAKGPSLAHYIVRASVSPANGPGLT